MLRDDTASTGHVEEREHSFEEAQSLLRESFDDADELPALPPNAASVNTTGPPVNRQSSLSQSRPDGTPRTTNRVRFDVEDNVIPRQSDDWVDEADYLHPPRQDAPLLTHITPPSDSPFLSDAFQPEDHLPNARPKSSLPSAVMNMANSIIGAGEQRFAQLQAAL